MPRDKRLYMTFPIDIHRHPKLARCSPAAKWTFVEMNGEARIAENDGIFSRAEAEFMWPIEHLDELINSHPTRPLVERSRWKYKIRDYEEHQLTRADREELTSKRKAAGQKGGQALAKHLLSKKKQTQAESESESELKLDRQTDVTTDSPPVTLVNAREKSDEDEFIRSEAEGLGIKNLDRVYTALQRVVPDIDAACAVDLARSVLDLSKTHVRSPEAYIEKAALNSPGEIIDRWAVINPTKGK